MAIADWLPPHEEDVSGRLYVRMLMPIRTKKAVGPRDFFNHAVPIDWAENANHGGCSYPRIGLAVATYLGSQLRSTTA